MDWSQAMTGKLWAHPRPKAPVRLILDVRLKPLRHAHAAVDRGRCPDLHKQRHEEAGMRLRLVCTQGCTSQFRLTQRVTAGLTSASLAGGQ